MDTKKEEREKLELAKQAFNVDKLTRQQTEFVLGRKLSDEEWINYSDLKISYWATEEARTKRKIRKQKRLESLRSKPYSIKHLFKEEQERVHLSQEEIKKLKHIENTLNTNKLTRRFVEWELSRKVTDEEWSNYNKPKVPTFNFSEIAKHAAKKAQRITQKSEIQNIDNNYRIAKLFRHNENTYRIDKLNEYYNTKYKTNRSEWKVHGEVDIFQMHNVIAEVVNRMTSGLPENVKLQVSLENSRNDRVSQTKLLNKQEIINRLAEWVNLFIDYYEMEIEDITFKLMAIEIPVGAGRVNKIITVGNKRSIIQVRNYDTICLARAIVVSLAVNNKEKLQNILKNKLTDEEIKQINKGRQTKSQINDGILSVNEKVYLVDGRKLQTVLAEALHRICKIEIKPHGNDFQDAKLFEEKLDIQIQIYNLESRQIYKGSENSVKLHILMSENHYDVISNLAGFTCVNESHHKKENIECKACKSDTKCNVKDEQVSCRKCNKYFYGKACFDNHIVNNRCASHSYICTKCHKYFNTRDLTMDKHKCDEFKCGNCKAYVPTDHECYMLKKKIKDSSNKYIFFDLETKLDPATQKHIVNYCVAQYLNGEERVFTTTNDFCQWIFNKSKHKAYTAIAHYGKGYDFQFIAEWLVAHNVKPNIIQNGQKILQLEVKCGYNIRFIDSISFTLMPLRDFPKTFGLEELAKGYFPHKFNIDENQNYIGLYPNKEFYGYDEMKKADKEKLDEWYKTTSDKIFNFKDEMYKYCRSDVDILRRGCMKLRELFMQIANIDPFQYMTIASVCQTIYRSEFLPENTIGICSENATDNYSIKSIKWLKYISQKEGIIIRHACNGGEQIARVANKSYKVDGYCEKTKTIYQFHGCYYHGCKSCYDELTINNVSKYNMKYLYKRTEAISTALRSAGYNLVTIWEHEFNKNKEMQKVTLNEYDLVEPPKIRDAFFGGRCEPVKLIQNFKEKNFKGKYIDVVSLYPTVMYYDRYPTGHPTKISKPKDYNKNWFGFVYCLVIPPRGLYLPVLPYKQKTKQTHKLMFGLCRTCMANLDAKCSHFNKNTVKCCHNVNKCQVCKQTRKLMKENCRQCHDKRNADCKHSDSERAITGFWTTAEIEKALEKGYKIGKIYDVWHFEHTSTELWKGYIRKFMKIKLETSKFTCSKEVYREKARKFGIELGELKENPGLRFIAKICLNSLWGKFGQNPKVKHSEYIDTEKDFYRLVLDDKIEQISLSFLNVNMVYASYERKEEFLRINYNTNIYIACFTSSWARLRLYDMLEKLEKSVCYCDTDSIVYIENEETKAIGDKYIGDSLGEWTDELGGNYMDFWCCAQAKDYGYILNNGKQAGKVKGFRVGAESEAKMTNEQRIKLIKGAVNHVDINYNQFTIKNCGIITKHMVKQWAFKFDKRMIRHISENDIDTLPYGY